MPGLGLSLPEVAERPRAGAAPPAAPTIPIGFALNGSANAALKAMLARVQGGTGRGRTVMSGDSITAGVGGAITSGTGDVAAQCANARQYRPSAVLAAELSAAGYAALDNAQYADGNVTAFGSTLPAYDPRVTLGSPAWTPNQNLDFGGGGYIRSNTGSFAFTPTTAVDRFEIIFLTSFAETCSLLIDDVAVVNTDIAVTNGAKSGSNLIVSSTPGGFCKAVIATTLGAHTLKIAGVATGGLMQSVRAWASGTSAIDICNHAAAGARSAEQAKAGDAPYDFCSFELLGYASPDLTIINLGLNDAFYGVAPSAYSANLQALITKAKLSGDVLLVSPHPAVTTWGQASAAVQKALRDAASALATSNAVAYLDLYTNFATWTGAEQGYADDLVHLRRQGYAKVGQLYRQCIQAMAV